MMSNWFWFMANNGPVLLSLYLLMSNLLLICYKFNSCWFEMVSSSSMWPYVNESRQNAAEDLPSKAKVLLSWMFQICLLFKSIDCFLYRCRQWSRTRSALPRYSFILFVKSLLLYWTRRRLSAYKTIMRWGCRTTWLTLQTDKAHQLNSQIKTAKWIVLSLDEAMRDI